MSAPRQSSPLSASADLEIHCPILQSLRDTSDIKSQGAASDKVSRMNTIQEESTEPEDDHHCLPCLHAPLATVEATQDGDRTSQADPEAISEYILKIREAIKLQGQRLQETQLESEQREKHERESEKLDFHIKVGRKKRRTSLLSGAKERGRNLVSDIRARSKRLSTVFPVPTKRDTAVLEVTSKERKHTSLPLGVEGTEGVYGLTPQRMRISAIFSPMRTKLPEEEKEKPKIKSKNGTPTYSSAGDGRTGARDAASAKKSYVEDVNETDDNSDEDSELVGLLSPRSVSSQPKSFDATHFYTPMIPSGSGRDYEYRLDRSRFRHAFDLSRELASKSVRKVGSNVGNVLMPRRKGCGWSKLQN